MKEKPMILASIGAALAASLCCIGPLVWVVLGLGAFGAASVFESFRPYLLGITLALLAGAFYLVYRPRRLGIALRAPAPSSLRVITAKRCFG